MRWMLFGMNSMFHIFFESTDKLASRIPLGICRCGIFGCLARKESLKEAVFCFHRSATVKVRFPAFVVNWEIKIIGEVVDFHEVANYLVLA